MNSFLIGFVLFTLLHYIEIVTSGLEEVTVENNNTAPLAVYQEKNGKLLIAKPFRQLKNQNEITFLYEDTENIEQFALACPAHTKSQVEQQNQWNEDKAQGSDGIQDVVLFPGFENYCNKKIIPTISKEENTSRCHKSKRTRKGNTYGVGYLVWNANKQNVEFVTIYKFCYTEQDGTLYTVHTIRSPYLLKFKNYYMTDNVYQSDLDTNTANGNLKTLWEEQEHDKNDFKKYQLVNYYDMATHPWKIATFFSFNHIPLRNSQMKKYFNTIDNYTRYFAKTINIELTVYSGRYTKRNMQTSKILFITKEYVTSIDEFIWKLIHDEEYNSIIIITHLPPYPSCNFICTYNPVTFDESEHGCTYTCQVDKNLLSKLGLEDFKSEGFLIFDLPAVVEPKELNPDDNGRNSVENHRNTINISSFLKTYINFQAAVSAYEAGKPIEGSSRDGIYNKINS